LCARHGWEHYQDDFAKLFASTTSETLERNVRVLAQICGAGAKNSAEQIARCAPLAQATLAALEAVDQVKAANDWRLREVNRTKLLAGLVQAFLAAEQPELLSRLVAHA